MTYLYDQEVSRQAWSPLLGTPGPNRQAANRRRAVEEGWDGEDNRPEETGSIASDIGTLSLAPEPTFNCETHGTITKTMTITIDEEQFTYCLRCLNEALLSNIGQVERINNE